MISSQQNPPALMQQSRAKLWIRTAILAVFGLLFGLALFHDLSSGAFAFPLALLAFLPCLAVGFWMRRWVPMQVHLASQHITLSFDRIYFALILLLVIAKLITGHLAGLETWTDVIMCVILGLMIGRLSGICLRVRHLKLQHGFLTLGTRGEA